MKPRAIRWVPKSRVIFRAERAADGPFYRYDAAAGRWVERPPWTAEELAEAAVNSTPRTGRIAAELGVQDFNPAGVIGHEESEGLLHTSGLPRAARTVGFEFDRTHNALVWNHEVPEALATVLDPKDGAFPNVSVAMYREFKTEGGQAAGPAIRHVAFLGASPPVKRNLGLWNPELYAEDAPAPEAAAVGVVTFGEGEAAEVTRSGYRPAGGGDVKKKHGTKGQGGANGAAPKAGTKGGARAAVAAVGAVAAAVTPERFAELETLLHDTVERTKRQARRLAEARDRETALRKTVARRETEHRTGAIEAFAEQMHRDGFYPGPERRNRIVATLRKLGGIEAFGEKESHDPVTVVEELLRAVAPTPVDTTTGGPAVRADVTGGEVFAEIDREYVAFTEWQRKRPKDMARASFFEFAEMELGVNAETVVAWAKDRKREIGKPRGQ